MTRDELRYILDPADLHGPDFPSERFRVLKAKEQKQFGEYLTRRLVLEAWDRLGERGLEDSGGRSELIEAEVRHLLATMLVVQYTFRHEAIRGRFIL